MTMTPFDLAQRLIGELPEQPGKLNEPFIQWCLQLVGFPNAPDEVPWCSAFLNRLFWMCRLPRSKSAMARSWLGIGIVVNISDAQTGDVVVLKRGTGEQPGPLNLTAPGHVGLFAGLEDGDVLVLAGNQGNNVSIQRFQEAHVLGIRRVS